MLPTTLLLYPAANARVAPSKRELFEFLLFNFIKMCSTSEITENKMAILMWPFRIENEQNEPSTENAKYRFGKKNSILNDFSNINYMV